MWFSSQASDAAADTMSDVHNHVVETERIGKLHVYVQGGIVNGQTVPGSDLVLVYMEGLRSFYTDIS